MKYYLFTLQKGRAARNARRKLPPNFESEEIKRAPHVLVFKRGTTGKHKIYVDILFYILK